MKDEIKQSDKKTTLTKPIYNEKISRSVLKALSWRVIASFTTFMITFLIIKISGYEFSASALDISLRVTLLEAFSKMIIYFFHERTWLHISYGKILPKSR